MKRDFYNINDLEKRRIRSLYYPKNTIRNDVVFECVISIDNRFFILEDNVYDIKEQKQLGYIWDSIDIFKKIFTTVDIENGEFKQLQENWRLIPILENKTNLYQLRDLILEFNFFRDTWLGRNVSQSTTNVKDAVSSGLEGLKDFGIAISQGEWSEILTLLKKGVVWTLRKLKDAAYSTLGMIVDTILISTGIGKGFQMATWGLIVALDAYQILYNDWPDNENGDPDVSYLDLGFSVLGFVFAGVAAKGARAFFRPLRGLKPTQMSSYVAKNPKMKTIIQNIYKSTKTAGEKLKTLQTAISKKWPNGSNFINKILGGFENLMVNLRTYCGKILSKSNLKGIQQIKKTQGGVQRLGLGTKGGIKRAATAGGISGGIGYSMDKIFGGEKQHSVGDLFNFNDMDFSSLPIPDNEF